MNYRKNNPDKRYLDKLGSEFYILSRNQALNGKISSISNYLRDHQNYENALSVFKAFLESSSSPSNINRVPHRSSQPSSEFKSSRITSPDNLIEEIKEVVGSNPKNTSRSELINIMLPPPKLISKSQVQVQLIEKSNSSLLSPQSSNFKVLNFSDVQNSKFAPVKSVITAKQVGIGKIIAVEFINCETGIRNRYEIQPKSSNRELISENEIILTNVNKFVFIQCQSKNAYFSSKQFCVINNMKLMVGKTEVTFSLNLKKQFFISYINTSGNSANVKIKKILFFRLNENQEFVSEENLQKAAGKIFKDGEGWKIINFSNIPFFWKALYNPHIENSKYPLPLLLNEDQLFLFNSEKYEVRTIN